jgi:protein-tyrosine phosphatase
VSCLTPVEESELGLEDESEVARSLGLEFSRIPIEDFGPPKPSVVGEAHLRISRSATPKAKVAIHCRQALGRSPLVAAAMLVRDGMKSGEAWETVARARGRPVPETEEQRAWLTRFAASESSVRGQA